MGRTLFTNVAIFDGSGKKPFLGEALIQGNRIDKVAKGKSQISREGAKVVDGGGATLMPGLTEAHGHITYNHCTRLSDIGLPPPEEHTLLTMHHAKLYLDYGFTSIFSAAGCSKPRIEIVIRNEINAGRIPGPRLKACSPEITATGSLGDERQMHMHHESVGLIADGPTEMRKAVRLMAREGVDNIKINISGDEFSAPGQSQQTTYSEEEVAVCAEETRARGLNLLTHARADKAVRLALKYHFDVIYHADYCTEKTIDMIEAKKKDVFLAPAAGAIYATAYEAADWGITKEVAESMNLFRKMESTARVYQELRKRGVRVLPGGDYGFAWTPHGTNSRDFEHFINLFGYTPAEVLRAATMYGGQLMGMGDELGLVKQGYLADLIMVDGDPLKDITLFQDKDNFLMIMKNGEYHKAPVARRLARRRAA